MAKTEVIKFSAFMDGSYKQEKKASKIPAWLTGVAVPLMIAPHAFAQEAVPVTATQVIGEKTTQIIAHALDPVVQLLVAMSLPVASVVMVGGCFFFMFGNSEKAWSMIQNAGLGYVLIQVSPMMLKVLEEVGKAV